MIAVRTGSGPHEDTGVAVLVPVAASPRLLQNLITAMKTFRMFFFKMVDNGLKSENTGYIFIIIIHVHGKLYESDMMDRYSVVQK